MPEMPEIFQFFDSSHLPPHLQEVVAPFEDLAFQICAYLPAGEQRALALTHLLQSKDAAVRAKILFERNNPVKLVDD